MGRRGLYIQDIHTLQVYVHKDHCNEAGEKPLCYVGAGSSGLIYRFYTVYNKNDLLWAVGKTPPVSLKRIGI